MKFSLKSKKFWVGIVIGVFAFVGAVYAFTSYRINHGQFLTLTGADSIGWWVHNYSNTLDYFIPNNSLAEWTAFKNAADSYLNDLRVERVTDLADLRPYFNSAAPAELPTYGSYNYSVRAKNFGPGTSENLAGACALTPSLTWTDGTPVGAVTPYFYGYVIRLGGWTAGGLAPLAPNAVGGSIMNPARSQVCPVGQEGDHPEGNILFTVDACHNNPDSDYTNNTTVLNQRCCGGPGASVNSGAKCCAGLSYSGGVCVASGSLPDLIITITNPGVLTTDHAANESFQVGVRTYNQGSGNAAASQTSISSSLGSSNLNIPALNAGQENIQNVTLTCPSYTSIHGITITADIGTPPGGQYTVVYEANEYNNQFWQGGIRCGY